MHADRKSLRIAVNAQLVPSDAVGGTGTVTIGLISALGQLEDGDEEYVIVTSPRAPDWVEPYLGRNQRIAVLPEVPLGPDGPMRRALGPLRPLARSIKRKLIRPREPASLVPVSDGFYERLGCQVIHFPHQEYTICRIPAIYNPHDLQHRHYPEFFTPEQLAWREDVYSTGCRHAHTVGAASQWIKQDFVQQLGLNPAKIQVVPWAPPTQAYASPSEETIARVKARYGLEQPFAFYPANTWEHKNHLRLLEALALLRDSRRLTIRLVCTGDHSTRFWVQVERRIRELRLDNQVRFLGRVPGDDLRAVYRLAEFMVMPTLFEATSLPIYEAWQHDLPVTCSTVTSLPDQVGDSAELFDPFSVEAIAKAMARLATDPIHRADLISRGRRRLDEHSWDRTARAYRAVYRRAAGWPLTEEDRLLLDWDWMRDPRRDREMARA